MEQKLTQLQLPMLSNATAHQRSPPKGIGLALAPRANLRSIKVHGSCITRSSGSVKKGFNSVWESISWTTLIARSQSPPLKCFYKGWKIQFMPN